MDRRDSDDFDDDLRSLEWLQSEDLLKNIGGEKLDKDDDDCEEQKENEDIKPDINLLQAATGQQPQVHPYMPQKHVNSKPPYSFSCLIFMAVENSPKKMLPVKDIYNWILKQFPYFQNAPTGWKNSVRHNLSLNKCFKKVEKDKGQSIGKGSLWCIDPAYRPNLLQALRKTPYHPYHQLQMTSTQPPNYINRQYQSLPGGGRAVLPLTQRPIPNTVSPHLFPFLSRRLAQTSFDVDNEMKDVAQTLVALKGSYKKESPDNSPGEDIGPTWKYHKRSYSYNNPRKRPSRPVTVTGHPYEDHAYSSSRLLDDDLPSPSSSSSIDEEYDFGDAGKDKCLSHVFV
jgi:forkhead box protein N